MDFLDYLRDELARRRARNAKYSVRAFGRDVGIDSASLSQILKGKRPLTGRTLRAIGCGLGLSDVEIGAWILRTKSSSISKKE